MTQPDLQSAVRHHQAGRLAEAEALYRQILVDHPAQSDVLHLLGVVAYQSGRVDEAVDFIQRAIQIEPARAEFHGNLALALIQRGEFAPAVAALERALELRPDFPQALGNLGMAMKLANRWDRAIAAYRQWTARRPNDSDAWEELGTALQQDRQFDQAIVAFRQALRLQPDRLKTREQLVGSLAGAGHFADALDAAEETVERWPDSPDARIVLAAGLTAVERFEEAAAECARAISIAPDNPRNHHELGLALTNLARFAEAMQAHRRAISLDPNFAAAHRDLGLLLIQSGDFENGFEEYQWRWRLPGLLHSPLEKEWNGQPLSGKRILLRSEGGHGDSIQLARYCPLVAARGGKVILQVPPQLVRLLQGLAGADQIASSVAPDPEHDCYAHLLSLPMLLKTTIDTIPAGIPYIQADPRRIANWKERLSANPAPQKNIGLVWAGGPRTSHDRLRSMPLKSLAPLKDIPGVRLISLQKGKPADQARQTDHGLILDDWTSELADWADTAALIACLDLVISVDTAVAHLAGAMGKPVWVLLPWPSDMRWLLNRQDSPWYPTMRLFRQTTRGDWTGPVAQLIEHLGKFVAQ